MPRKSIVKYGILHGLGAAAYVSLVALVMANGEHLFGGMSGPLPVFIFLMLFVLSAAVMGLSLFGRPIAWYLNNQKKEAWELLFYTLGFFILTALTVLIILISQNSASL